MISRARAGLWLPRATTGGSPLRRLNRDAKCRGGACFGLAWAGYPRKESLRLSTGQTQVPMRLVSGNVRLCEGGVKPAPFQSGLRPQMLKL
jgi:hypothetical protein